MRNDWVPLSDLCNSILSKDFVEKAREGEIPAIVVFQYSLFRYEKDLHEPVPGPEVESFTANVEGRMGTFYLQETLLGYIDIRRGDDDYDHLASDVDGLASKLKSEQISEVAHLPSTHIEPLPYNPGNDLIVLRNLNPKQVQYLQDARISVTEIFDHQ